MKFTNDLNQLLFHMVLLSFHIYFSQCFYIALYRNDDDCLDASALDNPALEENCKFNLIEIYLIINHKIYLLK